MGGLMSPAVTNPPVPYSGKSRNRADFRQAGGARLCAGAAWAEVPRAFLVSRNNPAAVMTAQVK